MTFGIREVTKVDDHDCEQGIRCGFGDGTAFWSNGRRYITKSQAQQKYDYVLEAAGPGSTYVLTAPVFSAYEVVEDRYKTTPHDWLLCCLLPNLWSCLVHHSESGSLSSTRR